MAKIDTDKIWRSLGTFWGLFPEEERVYLDTFWEAWADVIADLWGYTFQADKTKSLFSTTATFERRNVRIELSNLTRKQNFDFKLSGVFRSDTGTIFVRGFVPRDRRTFKAVDVPRQGLVRIGADTLRYTSANIVPVTTGPFTGYVREATFTLADSSVPHDYGDSIDLNDSFFKTEIELRFRVDQVAGSLFVDATSDGEVVEVNPTGRLYFGAPGFNYEVVDYQSVNVSGDRYVFNLPTTWGPSRSSAPALEFDHGLGDTVKVSVLSPSRWQVVCTGPARVHGDNAVVVVVDDQPGSAAPSTSTVSSLVSTRENSDFDLAVTMFPSQWPTVAGNERTAGVSIGVGSSTLAVALRQDASGTFIVAGVKGAETAVSSLLPEVPGAIEFRLMREGQSSVLQYRIDDTDQYLTAYKSPVSGHRAMMAMFVEDTGTDTASQIKFDEVVRRIGSAAGSVRLEDSFVVDDLFPFRYETDAKLTSVSGLQDRPRPKVMDLMLVTDVVDVDTEYIQAIGGDDFNYNRLTKSGVLIVDGVKIVYDDFTRNGSVIDFKLRKSKVAPSLLPLTAGKNFFVTTSVYSLSELKIPGHNKLWFRDLPTRNVLWAPLAQEDIGHVQEQYGPLVGLDAEVSSDSYLRRVQGVWYSLLNGPSIDNVRIGVHLTAGLPVAQTAGVVQRTYTESDKLGNMKSRVMEITGEKGTFKHYLDAGLTEINWLFGPGDVVDIFEPLTNGVEIWNYDLDERWPERFSMDPLSPERFNAFGVLVDIESLNSETSLADAVKFALRIKPAIAKIFFNLVLRSGDEDLDVEDDIWFTSTFMACEDISFDEGDPPSPEQAILRLGEGHKLGQGKHLGSNSIFQPFPRLSQGLHLGTGLTLDMPDAAYACDPSESNLPTIVEDFVVVIEVESES